MIPHRLALPARQSTVPPDGTPSDIHPTSGNMCLWLSLPDTLEGVVLR